MAILISASTNPPPLEELANYITKINNEDVNFIHCDVMDGKFVEAKTFNHKMVKRLKNLTSKKLDVHLMVKKPTYKIKKYIKSGADILTIHYEAYKDKNKLKNDLFKIKKSGIFAGIAVNPSTSIEEVLPFTYFCDMLLIMSVEPGKSGQTFLPETLKKLQILNKFLKEQQLDVFVEVDGGVNNTNIEKLIKLDVKSVVLGNYLYSSNNLKLAIKNIKNNAE